ncbi:pilus assembly protein [Donghicola sp. C2-DW-16]|uniref:Pilus assembly protein n=1 Tax=Donghicola mangrovi TaxID=2729614 RepID=A0ABX2PIW8_9RHOB|nr:TadE/TadG family type IV pilus assembly protein [Donghicola mangrovi]NVO29041.1 pilus assembly protein [Donghicola mangrovi]
MMGRVITWARTLLRSESATTSVEFVMVYPIFLLALLWSIETCIWMMRATSLERGLDIAIREVRLGSLNSMPTYDDLKDIVCDYSGMLGDSCATDLKLEMQIADPRAYEGLPDDADCVDHSEPIKPAINFTVGQANDLMLVRACARIEPVFPMLDVGNAMKRESDGGVALIAVSTFVQEP